MKKYVYDCLEKYGNVSISKNVYDKMGKNKILADLKRHGFECEIDIHVRHKHDVLAQLRTNTTYVIIQEKPKGGVT